MPATMRMPSAACAARVEEVCSSSCGCCTAAAAAAASAAAAAWMRIHGLLACRAHSAMSFPVRFSHLNVLLCVSPACSFVLFLRARCVGTPLLRSLRASLASSPAAAAAATATTSAFVSVSARAFQSHLLPHAQHLRPRGACRLRSSVPPPPAVAPCAHRRCCCSPPCVFLLLSVLFSFS